MQLNLIYKLSSVNYFLLPRFRNNSIFLRQALANARAARRAGDNVIGKMLARRPYHLFSTAISRQSS